MNKQEKAINALMTRGWNFAQAQHIIETYNISEKVLANFK
jgi:hypothetical protein|tara:strand:- start:948 stop:1067 length:120 start_codon:yes stop_codon:yes gene_type:complete